MAMQNLHYAICMLLLREGQYSTEHLSGPKELTTLPTKACNTVI